MATIRYTANGDYDASTSNGTYVYDGATQGFVSQYGAGELESTGRGFTFYPGGDLESGVFLLTEARDGPVRSETDGIFADFSDVGASTLEGGAMGDVLVGGSEGDTLRGFDGDDTLNGNDGDDTLDGGLGDDVLIGGTGSDTLDGGAGDDTLVVADDGNTDTLDGGAGNDTADFGSFESRVYAATGDAGSYSYGELNAGMSGIENLTGGSVGDFLVGDVQANVLRGGGGNDTLIGANSDANGLPEDGGADQLYGGTGNDVMVMFRDTAVVDGGAGNDAVLVGGQWLVVGADTTFNDLEAFQVSDYGYLDLGARAEAIAPIIVDVTAQHVGVSGSQGDDRLVFDFSNLTPPGSGGESLAARGAVAMSDEEAQPFYDGNAGFDTVDFSMFRADLGPLYFDLDTSFFTSFEGIVGSAFDDTLIGNEADNRIDGGAGDDQLKGGAGDDVLIGGGGGNNVLNGGIGFDTASYEALTASVSVNLLARAASWGETVDALTSIENVIGGQGDDLVRGSSRSNVLDGGAGDDRLIGADGDTLLGGAGDDILSLTIPSGPKSLPILVDGGDDAGLDRLVLRGGMATFNDDTLRHIDAVDVRGTGVDLADVSQGARITIYSAGGAEVFGTSGDDLIKGGRGSDTIEGGAGADRMFGSGPESREGDIFVFTHLSDMMGGGQTDRILDFGANDRIDLSQIDADPEQQDGIQHFIFVESFSDRGGSDAEVMVRADGGSNFTVLFDSNHDGLADASFRVVGAMPTEQNFILTPAQPEFG